MTRLNVECRRLSSFQIIIIYSFLFIDYVFIFWSHFEMDINTAPRLKDTKLKVKKTFAISQEAADTYIKAKELGVDATKICTDSLEESLDKIRRMIAASVAG